MTFLYEIKYPRLFKKCEENPIFSVKYGTNFYSYTKFFNLALVRECSF